MKRSSREWTCLWQHRAISCLLAKPRCMFAVTKAAYAISSQACDLKGEAKCKQPRHLSCRLQAPSEDDLEPLESMLQLRYLSISGPTEEYEQLEGHRAIVDLDFVSDLTQLSHLTLNFGVDLDCSGMQCLSRLTALTELRLPAADHTVCTDDADVPQIR